MGCWQERLIHDFGSCSVSKRNPISITAFIEISRPLDLRDVFTLRQLHSLDGLAFRIAVGNIYGGSNQPLGKFLTALLVILDSTWILSGLDEQFVNSVGIQPP